jgi:hypothetical protein
MQLKFKVFGFESFFLKLETETETLFFKSPLALLGGTGVIAATRRDAIQ